MNSPQDEQKDEGAMLKLPTLLFLEHNNFLNPMGQINHLLFHSLR